MLFVVILVFYASVNAAGRKKKKKITCSNIWVVFRMSFRKTKIVSKALPTLK